MSHTKLRAKKRDSEFGLDYVEFRYLSSSLGGLRQIGRAAAMSDHSGNKIRQIADCATPHDRCGYVAPIFRPAEAASVRRTLGRVLRFGAGWTSEPPFALALVHQAHPQTRDVANFGPPTLPPLHSSLFCDPSDVALVSGRRKCAGASANAVRLSGACATTRKLLVSDGNPGAARHCRGALQALCRR